MNKLIIANIVIFLVGSFSVLLKNKNEVESSRNLNRIQIEEIEPEVETKPNPDIKTKIPPYLNYASTVRQLKEWNEKSQDLTNLFIYGKSSNGTDLWCIRIHGDDGGENDPVVLTTACLHGNEPLSASTVMAYIGNMLDSYGEDKQITELIDTRDFYFVPIASPDSYPNKRRVDGEDPNRNFPTLKDPNRKSVPPVEALQNLFFEIKPNAVISGHTHGRVYLIPYGDTTDNCPNYDDYQDIMTQMSKMSRYRWIRGCDLYRRTKLQEIIRCCGENVLEGQSVPIIGTELDWYYRNGAASIVMEFGTHQEIPSISDIQIEFQRTFNAVLYFYEKAPLMEIKN